MSKNKNKKKWVARFCILLPPGGEKRGQQKETCEPRKSWNWHKKYLQPHEAKLTLLGKQLLVGNTCNRDFYLKIVPENERKATFKQPIP